MTGYKRGKTMEEMGIAWHTPSPNLPSLENARNYFALVFLEGINVSVGRGTQAPFIYIGAPWMDHPKISPRYQFSLLQRIIIFLSLF